MTRKVFGGQSEVGWRAGAKASARGDSPRFCKSIDGKRLYDCKRREIVKGHRETYARWYIEGYQSRKDSQ